MAAGRFWDSKCHLSRVRGKSNKLAALRLLVSLSSKCPKLNRIGAQLAIDLSHERYDKSLLEHIPGISNTLSDALSRLHASSSLDIPAAGLDELRLESPLVSRDFGGYHQDGHCRNIAPTSAYTYTHMLFLHTIRIAHVQHRPCALSYFCPTPAASTVGRLLSFATSVFGLSFA